MPRDKNAKFLHMLYEFKIIKEEEYLSLLLTAVGHKDLAAFDRGIIQELIKARRCTLDTIKVVLIIQQIDRLRMLIQIAENLKISTAMNENHIIALREFDKNDYEIITKEHKMPTGNQKLDQLYREARAVKACFKLKLVRIMSDQAARDKFLCLYALRGTSLMMGLMSKLFNFIPVINVEQKLNLEWQEIRKPLEQEFMEEMMSCYMGAQMKKVYSEFWPKIYALFNALDQESSDNQYRETISAVENYAQIAAGAPTPSPMASPRARSPRLKQ